MRSVLFLLLALLAASADAAQPFFAAAVPVGSLSVRLHPTEGVAAGSPKLVTFGLPFPRGSLSNFFAVINRDDPIVSSGKPCPCKSVGDTGLYERGAIGFADAGHDLRPLPSLRGCGLCPACVALVLHAPYFSEEPAARDDGFVSGSFLVVPRFG